MTVIVSNIGHVCTGAPYERAIKIFKEYVEMSKNNYGRVGHEDVILMDGEEIVKEFNWKNH